MSTEKKIAKQEEIGAPKDIILPEENNNADCVSVLAETVKSFSKMFVSTEQLTAFGVQGHGQVLMYYGSIINDPDISLKDKLRALKDAERIADKIASTSKNAIDKNSKLWDKIIVGSVAVISFFAGRCTDGTIDLTKITKFMMKKC